MAASLTEFARSESMYVGHIYLPLQATCSLGIFLYDTRNKLFHACFSFGVFSSDIDCVRVRDVYYGSVLDLSSLSPSFLGFLLLGHAFLPSKPLPTLARIGKFRVDDKLCVCVFTPFSVVAVFLLPMCSIG